MVFLLISLWLAVLSIAAWSPCVAPGYEVLAYSIDAILYFSFCFFYVWGWRSILRNRDKFPHRTSRKSRVLICVFLAVTFLGLNLAVFYSCLTTVVLREFEYGKFSKEVRFDGYRDAFLLWDSSWLDPETVITTRVPLTPYLVKRASLWGIRPKDVVIQRDGDKVRFLRPWGKEHSFVAELTKE